MRSTIEVLVALMEDESPDMILSSIPAGADVRHTLITGKRPSCTPRLVNRAIQEILWERGEPRLWMVVHPDIVLPQGWFERLDEALVKVGRTDPKWGLAGVMGVCHYPQDIEKKRINYGHLWDRKYEAGMELSDPIPVEALDELCVFLRGGREWRLDETLGTYHLWASELALREMSWGRKTYVLPGLYLEHHSTAPFRTPEDPYFFFGLGVLSERYRKRGTPLVTPSGSVHDYADDSGVRIL